MFDPFGMQRPRPRFTAKTKEALHKKQGGKCNGCGKSFDIRNLAVDHRRAFSREGSDAKSNLQLLCTACNSSKGAGTTRQLKSRLKKQGVIPKAATAKKTSTKKTKTTPTKKPATKRTRDPFLF